MAVNYLFKLSYSGIENDFYMMIIIIQLQMTYFTSRAKKLESLLQLN